MPGDVGAGAGVLQGAYEVACRRFSRLYRPYSDLGTSAQAAVIGQKEITFADDSCCKMDRVRRPEPIVCAQGRCPIDYLLGEREYLCNDLAQVAIKGGEVNPI